jgi:hypothetical protein
MLHRNRLDQWLSHDVAKHEQHLGALIPIDHAGLTDLVETLVASALK